MRLWTNRPIFDEMMLVSGSASAVRFPTGSAIVIRMKAYEDNIGPFYIGSDPSRMYYPMWPGDEVDWSPVDRTQRLFYQNASGTSEYLAIWLMR